MKRWGMVKHSLLGTGAKNFGGSHLGELGCFFFFLVCCLFCFYEEGQSLGRGKQDEPGCPLRARLPVASKPP